MKTIFHTTIALFFLGLLSSCTSPGLGLAGDQNAELYSVNDKPVLEDRLKIERGQTFRVRRYLVNQHPLETIKTVTMVNN